MGQSIPLCSGDAVNFMGCVPLNQISGGQQQKLRFNFYSWWHFFDNTSSVVFSNLSVA